VIYDHEDDDSGTPLIIYTAAFFKSGGGKSVGVNVNKKYFIDWLENEFSAIQAENDKRRKKIEIELRTISAKENIRKTELEEELLSLTTQPDIYLADATPEGLEASFYCESTPLLFLDNFGKYLVSSAKNDQKAGFLRMLDNIFDNGHTTTRRLKGEGRRATQLSVAGLGAHFASTLGESNLRPKDIRSGIEDGFFNKVLITFQDLVTKPIPLQSSLSLGDKDEIENYAKKFRKMAQTHHFYFSDDAFSVYADFHQKISEEFKHRYNHDEDMAGLIIRLLKISKRIACIFEIASICDFHNLESAERTKIPVSAENMERAIRLVQYLKNEHVSKLLFYAESKTGKLTKNDIVLHAIQRLCDDRRIVNHRSIIARLSKSQRMSEEELKPILGELMSKKRIIQNTDGSYTLSSNC
jgi:hypothetical protein